MGNKDIAIRSALADEIDAAIVLEPLLQAAATRKPLVLEELRVLGRIGSPSPARKGSASSQRDQVAHSFGNHVADYLLTGVLSVKTRALRQVADDRLRLNEFEAVDLQKGQLAKRQLARGKLQETSSLVNDASCKGHICVSEKPSYLIRKSPPRKVVERSSRLLIGPLALG